MGASKRFHYVVVASHEDGGESVAAGAISPESIAALIADFRTLGLTRIQIIETSMPETVLRAASQTIALAAE